MKLFLILLVLTTMTTFNSCKKRIIGCTDTTASNYDDTATENCDNCCTYYNVEVKVTWTKSSYCCWDCGLGPSETTCSPTYIKCGLKDNCNGTYFTSILQESNSPATFLFENIKEGTYVYKIEKFGNISPSGNYCPDNCQTNKCESFTITSGQQTTNISISI